MNNNPRMFIIVSKFRQQLAKPEVKYTVIRLEYAYKAALKYAVNSGAPMLPQKRQSSLLDLSPLFREGVRHAQNCLLIFF